VSDVDYITIQIRFPRAVLNKLKQAMTARWLGGTEGGGVIEAFLGRVLEDVTEGGGSHEYASGTITTTVLP
jgi:hypothetical protein